MKLKKFTTLCLCTVLLSSCLLAACKKSETTGTTPDEATTAVTTIAVTESTQEESSVVSPDATEKVTEEATQKATKKPSKNTAEKATEKSTPKTTKPKTQTTTKAPAENTKPAEVVSCTITVNGKKHTINLGDTITYTYYLKTPKKIENVQATVNYPGTTLELLDTVLVTDISEATDKSELTKQLSEVFPVLGSTAIYNGMERNVVRFNASNISGIDFTKGGYLIKLNFRVVSQLGGSISTNIEYMDEMGGNPYVDDGNFSKDVIFEEALTY